MRSLVNVTNVLCRKVPQYLLSRMESIAGLEMGMNTRNMVHQQDAHQMVLEGRILAMCTELKVTLLLPSTEGGAYEVLNYRITVDFFENYRNTVIEYLYKYRHRSIF